MLQESSPRKAVCDVSPIRGLLALIEKTWKPNEVWLFGSRARGDFHKESDWDLFVVLPDERATFEATDPMAGWRLRKKAGIQSDIIAVSESDFRSASSVVNTLAYEVAHEGVCLMSREKQNILESLLTLAAEDLSGARSLAALPNRNAIYLCSQAAEKIIRALLTSEDTHAGIKHDLVSMVDRLDQAHPLLPELRKVESLGRYATTFRYPTNTGRIPSPPPPDQIEEHLDDVEAALKKAAAFLGVELAATPESPASPIEP